MGTKLDVKLFQEGVFVLFEYVASDYFSLRDDGTDRWELIKGVFKMAPAPKIKHQRVSVELSTDINLFCRKKNYYVLEAPCDLVLGENVVQPDIMVICDAVKITELRCVGIPDLIVEVLSVDRKRDTVEKFKLYEEYGLREYWMVDPDEKWLEQWVLAKGAFELVNKFENRETVGSHTFSELRVDLSVVFGR